MKRRWMVLLIGVLILDIGIGCWWWNHWREHRYDKVIYAAAVRYGVAPELIKAVVWKESRFDAQARGRSGEYGLMQIRDAAAYEWAAAEHLSFFHPLLLQDPKTNTRVGAWYLNKLLRRYTNSDNALVYALADYNAGRGNVLRWYKGEAVTNSSAFLELMDFPATCQYIKAIVAKQGDYRGTFPNSEPLKQ